MIDLLKKEAFTYGDSLQVVSIRCLEYLKKEVEVFEKNEEINRFQKWIVDNIYRFDVPTIEFTIKSIIIIAIPHPAYAKVEFIKQGKKYNFKSLIMSNFDNTDKYLNDFLTPHNYHIIAAPNIPLKRLAVQSGLAVYGKNNVTYVDGMGSFFSFAAYFSDITCDNDDWMEMRQDYRCINCNICFNSCPTGAIRKERFLIDNERCLSYFNESSEEFPEWIPLTAHHCVYDCLKCQINCPMNKQYADNVVESIKFSEEETSMLLSGRKLDEFSDALKQKSKVLGLDDWIDAIPRNLKILFQLSDTHYNNTL